LVVTAVVGLLADSAPCSAQTEKEEKTDDAATQEVPAGVESEEIVVTATRREEPMSKVPITMSAVDAEQIEATGIRELKELAEFVPNVLISQSNDFRMFVAIRGVGANSRNIGFDTRVGVYLDGVYLGQSPALNEELLDLDRVEVLRGPQGTLFGRNTVAGAVNLITRKPSDRYEAKASFDAGNHRLADLRGFVNIPLSKSVAAKFSVARRTRDGYVENVTTGHDLNAIDSLAYRAQLRVHGSDRFDLNLSADGLDSDRRVLVGEPLTDMLGSRPDPFTNGANGVVAFNFDPTEKRAVDGGALDIDYQLNDGSKIKSITGYRKTRIHYLNATDYAPTDIFSIDYDDRYRQLTQEIQLISPPERSLGYLLGAYYLRQRAETARLGSGGVDFVPGFIASLYNQGAFSPPLPPAPALPPDLVARLLGFDPNLTKRGATGNTDTTSYAAYFNSTYQLSARLQLGAGARYTEERRDADWFLDGRGTGFLEVGSTGPDPNHPSPLIESRRDTFLAPAVSLRYTPKDDLNLYARYAAGFKSGGFNVDIVTADQFAADPSQSFDPESVHSFDVGMKARFLDRRLEANLAVFVADYHDYQVNQLIDLGGGRATFQITNAAKVKTQGFEGDFQAQIGDALTVQGTLGLLDAKFVRFPDGGEGGADVSGKKLPNAPQRTASLGGQYFWQLSSLRSSFMLRLDATYRSGYFTTPDNVTASPYRSAYPGTVPFGWLPERTLLDGRIGWIPDKDRWEVYLWGRNLTNQIDPIDGFRDFFGTIVQIPSIGRTFGLGVTWHL